MSKFEIKPAFPDTLEVEGAMSRRDYNYAFRCLQNFYALASQGGVSPAADTYTPTLRRLTFVPFGGPNNWNRVTELIMREIEKADAKHAGRILFEDLELDWKLSGLNREEYLNGEVEIVCSRCGR